MGRNYTFHPEMELPPAAEYVQLEVERRLHQYLHTDPANIRQIVIVGTHLGEEIPRLKRVYPNSRFVCFEPSPKVFGQLQAAYRNAPYVECRQVAIADVNGEIDLYEMSDPGNASVLKPDTAKWALLNQRGVSTEGVFRVPVTTLDLALSNLTSIDLLWVDVQGAELKVLSGASESLRRTRSIILEVALQQTPYEGAVQFKELDGFLARHSYQCCALGVDPWSFAGNALWVRNLAALSGNP